LDPAFVRTLPTHLISDGLAEAIKIAIVMDPDLFEFIERYSSEFLEFPCTVDMGRMTDFVQRSAVRLLEQLEPNLYEDKTYRRLLDFGHTFSPLIESESGFRVTHGMAVSIDIAISTQIAFELGLVSVEQRDRILCALVNAGLPIHSDFLTAERACDAMAAMKAHRGGHLNLVLPSGIGTAIFITDTDRLTPRVLRRAIDRLRRDTYVLPFAVPRVSPAKPVPPRSIRKTLAEAMPLSPAAT
jgi:3-dehydroquinate synthase